MLWMSSRLAAMRKALALALLLTVSGCSFSSVDPDAEVSISGRALDASGKPLAGAKVLLVKQADLGEVVFGTVLAVGTLSAVCFLPDPPAICRKAESATTDAQGGFEFDLKGSDTQGTLGTESTLNVVFSGADGKASTTLSFAAKDTEITLPDARLWNAAPTVSQTRGKIQLAWTPLPREAGARATYSAQLFEGRAGSALWSQPASGRRATLDPRLLEDRNGSVAVGASTELSGGSGAGDVRASFLSQRLAVRATAGVPRSRGRRCAAVTGTSPARDEAFSACAATDGTLDQPARLSGAAGAVVVGAAVDLGSPRPVSLVVARGFGGQVLLEVSGDGRTYRTVASGSGQALVLEPTGRTTARFVRLRSPTGLDQSLSSELSVW